MRGFGSQRLLHSRPFQEVGVGQRLVLAWSGGADIMHEFDRRAGISYAESASRKNVLIDARVEIGKSFREFNLVAVHGDGAKRRIVPGYCLRREVFAGNGEIPADGRFLQFKITGHAVFVAPMDFAPDGSAENPLKQIEKVNADVRRQSAGTIGRPFPGIVIPW